MTQEINLFAKDYVSPSLEGVEGVEGLYAPFHRFYVLRKRNELLNPKFFNIGDVQLPFGSVIHYLPNDYNSGVRGPSNNEPFISNYKGGDVFIEFFNEFDKDLVPMGSFRKPMMEFKKERDAYRSNHFNYKWMLDINVPLRKTKSLVVRNYALIDKRYVYRANRFRNYYIYYNRMKNLFININRESERSDRHQFIRMDLGNRLFGWMELLTDYDNYCSTFTEVTATDSNGKNVKVIQPLPTNRSVRLTKQNNSYWILDWLAFMFGDYEYSVFNTLTEKSMENLHILFTHDTKTLVIKLSTLKGWLDERLTDGVELSTEGSNRDKHKRRVNVTKRLYLIFLNMVNGSVLEQEVMDSHLEVLDQEGQDNEELDKENQEETLEGKEKEDSEKKERVKRDTGLDSNTGDDSNTVIQPGSGSDDEKVHGAKGQEEGSSSSRETKSSDDGRRDTEGEETSSSSVHEESEEGGGGESLVKELSWDDEVDDSLLEVEEVKEVKVDTNKDIFKTPISGVEKALETRARQGTLTVKEQEFFLNKAKKYKEIKLDNGQTMEEFMEIKKEDITSLKEDSKIEANFTAVLDESMLNSRAKVLKSGYVKKVLDKQIVSNIVAIQNAGIAINDFKKETITGVEGSYDVFSLQLHPVGGDQSTHHIRIPKINEEGTFIVDGVKNHMQLQRMEIPIRKINHRQVALTSYYPSKILISRDKRVVNDLSHWLPKQVLLRAGEDDRISYDRGSSFNHKLRAPRMHSALSMKFKWIKVGDVTLDFRFNELIKNYPEFSNYNTPDNFLIGVHRKKPVIIDSYGTLFIGDKDYGTIEEVLGVDTTKAPNEFCTINIRGYNYPVGVVLCYYFGIDKLLEILKAEYRTEPTGTRIKLDPDEYKLTFSDEHLIFNRRNVKTTLIFGGLAKLKNLSNFSRVDLNNQGIWVPLLDDVKVKPSHFTEMNNLLDLFIDPITKGELAKLKHSVSFHYLLIDAVEMLETDWSRASSEIEEQRVVGYERIAGHMYRELCNSVRQYRNKGTGRKFKLEINPDIVLAKILTDTSVNQVEDVNPIHQLKEQEEITFGGTGGRSEISVVLRDRLNLSSNKGILSEGGKDSGKAGYVSYLTADPRIADYSGNIDVKDKGSITGLRSTTGNLAVSTSKED